MMHHSVNTRISVVHEIATSSCALSGWILIVVLMCSALLFADDDVRQPQLDEAPITSDDRDHWAFRPLTRPAMPQSETTGWGRNAIDRFILARLNQEGLSPVQPASRASLIRRVTFDLTGLPPSPSDVAEFVAAENEDSAYNKLVDRLLASPAYGERWALHWLDLARFAETDGFEHDLVRHNAWRYRDWVINALNADMPYDQFVKLQLAGDQLAKDDPSQAIPTGFLLCGPDMPDINLQDERRHTVLNELTSTVGAVLMGLQVGCAQCHDHKYDPISQADFYRLRAHFDSLELFQEQPVPTPAALAAHTELIEQRKKAEQRAAELDELARDLLSLPPELEKERERLASQLAANSPKLPQGRVVSTGKPKTSFVMIRGDFRRPGAAIEAAFPRVLNPRDAKAGSPSMMTDSRLDLADWLTDRSNPIFARVMANRLWQYHFGTGIVPTSSDFGRMGDEPSHPELLDWLATELIQQEFSLKSMHRLIVTSSTYRLASRRGEGKAEATLWEQSLQADPKNELWSRRSRTRLEGEAIRDAMLAASGTLNDRRGGPGIQAPLPSELVATLLKNQWNVAPDPMDHHRRSIYLFVRRNLRYPLFEAFDRPDTNASCPRRNQSTIAPQALFLLNSEFSLNTARDLAARILAECGPEPGHQVESAYQRVLCRKPTPAEQADGVAFLERIAAQWKATQTPQKMLPLPSKLGDETDPYTAAALTTFGLALFNLNEFVYVD